MSYNSEYNFYENGIHVECKVKCCHINIPCECNQIKKITITFNNYNTNIDIEKNPAPTAPNTPDYTYTPELRQYSPPLEPLQLACDEECISMYNDLPVDQSKLDLACDEVLSDFDSSDKSSEEYNPITPQWCPYYSTNFDRYGLQSDDYDLTGGY